MPDEDAPLVIECGNLRFERVSWFHDDENWCSHISSDKRCTNPNGVWRPVYKLVVSNS